MVDIEKDAKELLENAKKQRKGESKGAPSASSAENKKTEEELEREKKDAEAKRDEEILSKKDGELNAEEKKRKQELLDIKKKENEKLLATPDDKLDEEGKKRKADLAKKPSKMEIRIHELVDEIDKLKKEGKKSAEKDKRIKTLEEELTAVKKTLSMAPEDLFKEQVKKARKDRISKYIEEDKDKPREERREMSKEELNAWLEEDLVSAQRWIARNEMNKRIEDEAYQEALIDAKKRKELSDKQRPFEERVIAKHPELDIDKREAELKSEGKEPKEIHKILLKENEKYRICSEIVKENPRKYLMTDNGPELVMLEMEKRLSGAGSKKEETSKVEELERKLNEVSAELARVKNVDISIQSNRSPEVKDEDSELGKELRNLAAEVGLPVDKVLARVKKRTKAGYGR